MGPRTSLGLRSHPGGAVLDIALGARGFGSCSIARFFVPDPAVIGADHTLFVDIDGDSRQDLVTINGSQALVATRRGDYGDLASRTTSLDPDAVAVTGGDFDGDHHADLWAVSPDGTLRVLWRGLVGCPAPRTDSPQRSSGADRGR